MKGISELYREWGRVSPIWLGETCRAYLLNSKHSIHQSQPTDNEPRECAMKTKLQFNSEAACPVFLQVLASTPTTHAPVLSSLFVRSQDRVELTDHPCISQIWILEQRDLVLLWFPTCQAQCSVLYVLTFLTTLQGHYTPMFLMVGHRLQEVELHKVMWASKLEFTFRSVWIQSPYACSFKYERLSKASRCQKWL